MRAIFIAVGLILFIALVYWTGMMVNFPGDAGSRYIESLVNRDRRIVLRMSPLELKWNRLVAERVALENPPFAAHQRSRLTRCASGPRF